MWWRRRKQPDADSPETDRDLRAQLVDACEKVRRQIEAQNRVRYSRGGGHGGDDLAVEMLQSELDRLEAALAELDHPDSI